MIKRMVKKVLTAFKKKKNISLKEVQGNQKHPVIQKILSNSAYYIKKLHFEKGAQFRVDNEQDIITEIDGVKMKFTCFEELFIINEVFNDLVYSFVLSDDIMVLDVGSNIGTACLSFSKCENVKKVVGFEPVPETFKRLNENLLLNNNPSKILINNFGLGSSNKKVSFEFSSEYKGSVGVAGLNDEKRNKSKEVKKVEVEIRDCKEVFEEIINTANDLSVFLKIDCEGGEYEIIPRLYESGLLRKIKYIVMEWHGEEYKSLLKYFTDHNCFFHKEAPPTGMLYAIRKGI